MLFYMYIMKFGTRYRKLYSWTFVCVCHFSAGPEAVPDDTSPVPPAITIETTCTPAEVRPDPGKKQDILHAVNTAQVHNFPTDIDIDATGLLTPDVISTSDFIQSINSAAREYTIYKKHLTTYKQKSTRSWGKSKLQSQLDAVQHSISEVKFKLSYVMAIDLDIPELTAKIKRAADKLAVL